MTHPALLRFEESLGRATYCSNTKMATMIRARSTALHFAYIGLNQRRVSYLALDIDEPGAAIAHESAGLPPPTIITITPESSKAHLLYELAAPVSTAGSSRQKPIALMKHVRAQLTEALLPVGADPGYAHLMTKNPLSSRWRVVANDCRYDLQELLEYLPDRTRRAPTRATGDGRNCTLFDQLRTWAYPRVAAARAAGSERWHEALLAQAELLNSFGLPHSEVRSVAKSVASWTWRRYSGSTAAPAVLAAVQAISKEYRVPVPQVLALWPGAVAKKAGVSVDTVQRLRDSEAI